jgi:hypothetical protein
MRSNNEVRTIVRIDSKLKNVFWSSRTRLLDNQQVMIQVKIFTWHSFEMFAVNVPTDLQYREVCQYVDVSGMF